MNTNIISVSLMAGLLMAGTALGHDFTQTITLKGYAPPISNNLSSFMAAQGRFVAEPFVGFNGQDIGYGSGDGLNEAVPFSFYFHPVKTVKTAQLSLLLTLRVPPFATAVTDALIFAQQGNPVVGYGNTEIKNAALNKCKILVPCSVFFDLSNISASYGVNNENPLGQKDIRRFVQGGQLDVTYADDMIVSSATLTVNGIVASPTPSLPKLPVNPKLVQLLVPLQD